MIDTHNNTLLNLHWAESIKEGFEIKNKKNSANPRINGQTFQISSDKLVVELRDFVLGNIEKRNGDTSPLQRTLTESNFNQEEPDSMARASSSTTRVKYNLYVIMNACLKTHITDSAILNSIKIHECGIKEGDVIVVERVDELYYPSQNFVDNTPIRVKPDAIMARLKQMINVEGELSSRLETLRMEFTQEKDRVLAELEKSSEVQKKHTQKITGFQSIVEELKAEVRLPGLQSIAQLQTSTITADNRWLNTPYTFPKMIGARCIVNPAEAMWYETVDGMVSKLVMGALSGCPSPTVHQIAHSMQVSMEASKVAVIDAQCSYLFDGSNPYLASDVVRMGRDGGIVVVIDVDPLVSLNRKPMQWGAAEDNYFDYSIFSRIAALANTVAYQGDLNYRVIADNPEPAYLTPRKTRGNLSPGMVRPETLREDSVSPPPEEETLKQPQASTSSENSSSFCIVICVTNKQIIKRELASSFDFPGILSEACIENPLHSYYPVLSKRRPSNTPTKPSPTQGGLSDRLVTSNLSDRDTSKEKSPYSVSHPTRVMPKLHPPNKKTSSLNRLVRPSLAASIHLPATIRLHNSAIAEEWAKRNDTFITRVVLPNAETTWGQRCVVEFQVLAVVTTNQQRRTERFYVGFVSNEGNYFAFDPIALSFVCKAGHDRPEVREAIPTHPLLTVVATGTSVQRIIKSTNGTRLAVALGYDTAQRPYIQLFYSDSQGLMERRGKSFPVEQEKSNECVFFRPFMSLGLDEDEIVIDRVSVGDDCNRVYFPSLNPTL